MSKEYVLVVDSTIDLPNDFVSNLDVVVLPLKYHMGDKDYTNYLDYREQDVKEFYDLVKGGMHATTSQLVPDDFITTLTPFLEEGKDVIIAPFSSELSGTYNSSRLAVMELKESFPERNIITVDTKSASLGYGLLMYLTSQAKKDGLSILELEQFILDTIPTVAHWFTVDDISHLRRGGRISAVSSVVAKALSIKPIMHCSVEGKLIPRNKAITRKKSISALFAKMAESAVEDQRNVFIGHGDDIDAANILSGYVKEKYPNAEILINNIGPVIGAHTGQGVLALFFVATER